LHFFPLGAGIAADQTQFLKKDTYSHVLPGLQEATAERFDRLLEGRVSETEERADVSKW